MSQLHRSNPQSSVPLLSLGERGHRSGGDVEEEATTFWQLGSRETADSGNQALGSPAGSPPSQVSIIPHKCSPPGLGIQSVSLWGTAHTNHTATTQTEYQFSLEETEGQRPANQDVSALGYKPNCLGSPPVTPLLYHDSCDN